MKKNLLALSIAAMVGGIAGGANAQVVLTTTGAASQRVSFSDTNAGKLLAAPVVAGVSTAANSLRPSTIGTGHILFVPYFTTQNDNASLLNIVNTDLENGKAVKLRYRGASNSDDLFDITIYLSPGDVWTANVSAKDGLSALTTDDKSCTLPSAADIVAAQGKFKTDRVRNNAATETREGYIEILNMADIPSARVRGVAAESDLYKAIKHVNGVAPCTQAVMDLQEFNLANNDPVHDPFTRGYSWPTGGLFANWTIINTNTKSTFTGEAEAVRALDAAGRDGRANLVWSPQTTAPVSALEASTLTADPLLSLGQVRAASYDFPDLSTPYTVANVFGGTAAPAAQANQLANSLAVTAVTNEFLTNQAVKFATDWVFSMPTRRYAVALNYADSTISDNTLVAAHYRKGVNGNAFLNKEKDRICVNTIGLRAYDREESTKTTFVISPDSAVNLCGEVSVLSFNSATSSVLGAALTPVTIQTQFADGWFRVGTFGLGNGLPVIGFAAVKAQDANQGNLGGTWSHRYN